MREFYVKLLYLFYPALIIYGFSQGVSAGPGPRTAEHPPDGYEPTVIVNTKPDPWDDEVHVTHTSDTFLENMEGYTDQYHAYNRAGVVRVPDRDKDNVPDDRDWDMDNDGYHDTVDPNPRNKVVPKMYPPNN